MKRVYLGKEDTTSKNIFFSLNDIFLCILPLLLKYPTNMLTGIHTLIEFINISVFVPL